MRSLNNSTNLLVMSFLKFYHGPCIVQFIHNSGNTGKGRSYGVGSCRVRLERKRDPGMRWDFTYLREKSSNSDSGLDPHPTSPTSLKDSEVVDYVLQTYE